MQDRRGWIIVVMLFLAGGISYLDRAAISIAAPLIARDFGLPPAQLGIVFSSFFIGYAPFCFLGGLAADRFGAKGVFLISMTVWSVACGFTATATSVAVLVLIRIVFGMGEGPYNATTVKMVSRWFTQRRQAGAIGLTYAGQPLGAALAGPVIGTISVAAGWRVSFLAVAVLGLLWVACWWFVAKEQPETPPLDPGLPAHLATADVRPALPVRRYLVRPTILATALAFFGYAYVLYFFLSWFPSYLVSSQHLSLGRMSVISVLPWTAGAAGLAIGGVVCDAIYRRTGDAILARKSVLVTSLLIASVCVALVSQVQDLASIVTLMTVGVFFLYVTSSIYYAIVLDTVDAAAVGSVSGFINLTANIAGLVAPTLTGVLIEWTGSYGSAFVLTGVVAFIGAAAVLVFVVRPPQPVSAGIIA